jgi:hypothetical protein
MEQIEKGMTRDEVEDVLGVPPGIYTEREPSPVCHSFPPPDVVLIHKGADYWLCDEGELLVLFDRDGRAEEVLVQDADFLGEPSLVDRARRKLGLEAWCKHP